MASRNSSLASAASRNSSASSASSIKTLYVINHLRDVERMLTSMPRYWQHWSWQSPIWKWPFVVQCLFHISSSLPWTWWRPTSLQLSLSGSCSTSRSCQPWIPTSISVFTFGSFLIPFGSGFILPKLSGSRIETKAKQKCSSSNLF